MNYVAVNELIGSPWVYIENDCYAVVKRGLKTIFGIDVPNIDLPSVSSPTINSEIFSLCANSRDWNKIESPAPGSVVMFYNRHGRPFHCGLYIEKGMVLHCWGSPKVQGSTVYEKLKNMNKALYAKHEFYAYNTGS